MSYIPTNQNQMTACVVPSATEPIENNHLVTPQWAKFFNNLVRAAGIVAPNVIYVSTTSYSVSQYDKTIIVQSLNGCTVTLPSVANNQSSTIPNPVLFFNSITGNIYSDSNNVTQLWRQNLGNLICADGGWSILQFDGKYWRCIAAGNPKQATDVTSPFYTLTPSDSAIVVNNAGGCVLTLPQPTGYQDIVVNSVSGVVTNNSATVYQQSSNTVSTAICASGGKAWLKPYGNFWRIMMS